MSTTWLLISALLALATAIAIAMTLIAVGHQSHERRPGTIDLTGIQPGRGWEGPSASRVRAEAGPPQHLRSSEAFFAANAELAGLSEHELAARVAQAGGVHETGGQAA